MHRLAIEKPVSTLMFFIGMVILGLASFKGIRTNLFPRIDYPAISVIIETRPSNPEWIEAHITRRAEKILSSIPGIANVVSVITPYGSAITLYFNWGENMDIAFIKIKEKTLTIERELRENIRKIKITELGPSAKPFMGIVFPESLKDFVREEIASRINTLDGVGKTVVYYYKPAEYLLSLSPIGLINSPFSLGELVNILKFSGIMGNIMGFVKIEDKTLPVVVESPVKTINDIGNLQVENTKLTGIAKIDEGDIEMSCYNAGKPACALFVYPSQSGSFLSSSKRIKEFLKNYNINYKILFDKSTFIRDSISGLLLALISGIVLSWLVLFVFLRNPSIALTVGISIPVSIISSFFIYRLFDIDINLITLGALIVATGMLVDSSIVVIESVSRRLDDSSGVIEGVTEVRAPVIASVLTNCVVFLPAIFVGGFYGRILKPFAIVIVGSLFLSLLVSLTLVPAIGQFLKSKTYAINHKILENYTERIIQKTISQSRIVIGILIITLFATIPMIRLIKFEAIPMKKTGNIKFRLFPLKNVNEKLVLKRATLVDTQFLMIHSKSGTEFYDVFFKGVEDYDLTTKLMKKIFPEFYLEMEEYDNPEEDLKFSRMEIPRNSHGKTVVLNVNIEKLMLSQIPLTEFKTMLKTLIGGINLFEINDQSLLLNGNVKNLEDILNFPLKTGSTIFQIKDFVEVREKPFTGVILRQNGKRVNSVAFRRFKELKELILSFVVSIILVFLSMAAYYNSFFVPFLVMFSIPAAFLPVPFALYMFKMNLNPMSIIGLIVLAGIAVNNSIILLDYTRRLMSRGYSVQSALLTSVKRRVRPILMTSLTTMLALTPLALKIGPGGIMESSMAVVIISGLLFSTVSALFLLPPIYRIFLK